MVTGGYGLKDAVERDNAPPGASLTQDAMNFVARMGALHDAIVQLRDKVHGPMPRPAPDGIGKTERGNQPLRLSLDRAVGILEACQGELANIVDLL